MPRTARIALAGLLLPLLAAAPSFAQRALDEELNCLIGLTMRSPFLERAAVQLVERIGPRPAGTATGRRAQALAAETFRRAGVPLVRLEPFPVPVWQVDRATVALVSPTDAVLASVPLPNSASTPPAGIEVPVVDAGHGTPGEIAELGDAVAGSAVLVRTGTPEGVPWLHRSRKYSAAVEAGAAAFLMMDARAGAIRTGSVTLDGSAGAIPAFGVDAAAGGWLARLATGRSRPSVRLILVADRTMGEAANVVADIPGRDPDEVILVAAHLDSWDLAQGAVDNGSGTLVLWQVARALVEQGRRPQRTVRFVAFMGEENGLAGSRAFVRRHRDELDRYRAVINLDMVGEPTGFGTMLQPGAAAMLGDLAVRLAGFGLDERVPDRPMLFSDHQPFLLEGVPVLQLRSRLSEDALTGYHNRLDTFDRLDLPQLQRSAAVVAALTWTLASADELPTRTLGRSTVRRALVGEGLGWAIGEPAAAGPAEAGSGG